LRYLICIAIILSLFIFHGCTSTEKIDKTTYYLKPPPNGVLINKTLFCDQTEASNFFWLEYLFWNKRIFGNDSKEYLNCLPDTTVWKNYQECLEMYTNNYLYHPAYRDYPVVGITKEQAENFSKWRSDRVFELLLIRLNLIEVDTTQSKETYFSIEKYYTTNPNEKKVDYYPEFRLPNLNERALILQYSDSIDNFYLKKCNTKHCKTCKSEYPWFFSDVIPCVNDTINTDPTCHIKSGCYGHEKKSIYNLRGNVNEITSESSISVGGGWVDTRNRILESDTFQLEIPNAWTGFRNVVEWKKWGD